MNSIEITVRGDNDLVAANDVCMLFFKTLSKSLELKRRGADAAISHSSAASILPVPNRFTLFVRAKTHVLRGYELRCCVNNRLNAGRVYSCMYARECERFNATDASGVPAQREPAGIKGRKSFDIIADTRATRDRGKMKNAVGCFDASRRSDGTEGRGIGDISADKR